MSYGFGDEYGDDQIHVGVEDVREYLGPFDVNRPGGVKSINARETRLRKKIQQYTPSCERKREMALESPDFFTRDGMYETRRRKEIRDNIERKYYGDRELRDGPDCKFECPHKEQFTQVQSKLANSQNGQKSQQNQMNTMHQEMLEMEKKNNMLVMFIFFLAVVILVQYSKLRNDPRSMQFLVMPNKADAAPVVAAQPVAAQPTP